MHGRDEMLVVKPERYDPISTAKSRYEYFEIDLKALGYEGVH